MTKITPDLFDNVLELLWQHGNFDGLNTVQTAELCKEFSLSLKELRFVFGKLMKDGLIDSFNDRQSVFLFLLSHDIWELLQKGGYTAHFKIAKDQLRLLEAEVAKLDKKVSAEQIERFTNIINNIYSFFPKNLMDL